ncbi:unnamed protein product [Allacma fusca]|uniref:Uncharacterized protein n=1 Tax=Allacma fusca TaxID=39272 RepID=A0A8J2KIC2_9HEXA|nr:unnamed protein product [Allacma fusca]
MNGYAVDSEGRSCSADDKEIVLESEFLNIAFALEEQLCNPSIAPRFRNVLKNLANLDILDCVFGGESRQLQDECYGKKFDQDKYHARFQDLGIYFECMKPGELGIYGKEC